MILGFDPGRDKCGVAVMNEEQKILDHRVIDALTAIDTLQQLCAEFNIDKIVMGDRTTSKTWRNLLVSSLSPEIEILMVDENNSTLEARDRYWQMYPPQGLQRIIPQGMRLPPRPVDDIVAILLIERYLARLKPNGN
jgi:RNase H-fold protein (predicted Holliday junction resolvase)